MTVAVEAGAIERVRGPAEGAELPLRLGGRFRLDEPVTVADWPGMRPAGDAGPMAAAGVSLWKATDEVLCRPVTIYLLPGTVPVPAHVAKAVRAAARVNDPRLAAVYDTDYSSAGAYIVSEWTRGTHLEDLVLSGLPSPALAAAMIADAAGALAVAHEAGLPHLRLSPRSLRWDTGSGLKITGLGIDAALAGTDLAGTSADCAAADTTALGRMLYALLTGFWPGQGPTAMPAAPQRKGRVYTPRQVRAGVPGVLDAITCHALQLQAPGVLWPALTPAWLAAALRSVQRPSYPPYRPAEPDACPPAATQDAGPRRHARHRMMPLARGLRHRAAVRQAALGRGLGPDGLELGGVRPTRGRAGHGPGPGRGPAARWAAAGRCPGRPAAGTAPRTRSAARPLSPCPAGR
jgi:hypothetical protein